MGRKNRNRRKKKKKQQSKPKIIQLPQQQIPHAMPHITSGEFDFNAHPIEHYQAVIDAAPKRDRKIRLLIDSEATYLKTGFSTYFREVIGRLHATGKYEIAELGSYGAPAEVNPLASTIPWKYYHCIPTNAIEDAEFRKDRENQFGKWKLSWVLSDFKPDIVLLHRDNWMDRHVLENPLRDKFLVFWMPTVDGYPQKWEWLRDYEQVDVLLTYSYFGKRVLEEQSRCPLAQRHGRKPLSVSNVAQPGTDINVYKPVSREVAYAKFGVPAHVKFIGTVMRNQPRKLFDRLIQSFAQFKRNHPIESKDVYLLLHTSIPDVGWDIPELVARSNMQDWVRYTYMCDECHKVMISHFIGSPTQCVFCGAKPSNKNSAMHTPNTQVGVDDETLASIYNLMYVYVQGSIAEGDGMPVNEAKACGIPTLCSDYSALSEKARNGGAIPINNATIFTETGSNHPGSEGTMQWRSLFDKKDLVRKFVKLFKDEGYRDKLAREARECAEKFYNWDLTAKKWEALIDTIELKDRSRTWESTLEVKELPKEQPPEDVELEKYIEWCYKNILKRSGVDPEGLKHWSGMISGGKITKKQFEDHLKSMIEKDNKVAEMMQNPEKANPSPIERVKAEVKSDGRFKILYAMPETAGDVFISTGIFAALKEKFADKDPQLYVATKKEFFDILEGCPNIDGVIEYHDSMYQYRAHETWGPQKNAFDVVYCPFIVTQLVPHWIHGGHGEYLGDVYADMCNVDYDEPFIEEDHSILQHFVDAGIANDERYITVHSQSRQDPKDFDRIQDVVSRLKDILTVQIGGPNDKKLENVDLDLRGKTTPQQLAAVLRKAKMHLGMDSFPLHIAAHVDTPVVALFGGTYAKQGTNPRKAHLIHSIETPDRGLCVTSCHLIDCQAKQQGLHDKCINNISVETVLDKIGEVIGEEYVVPPNDIKLSAYMIIKDGIKYGFPFEKCINAARLVASEVVVVDGGSTDGTLEKLREISEYKIEAVKGDDGVFHEVECGEVKVLEHEWDMDNPTLMGDEKTYARRKCTGDYLIQLDADEIIHEPYPGAILDAIRLKPHLDVLDLPCINFYGDGETVRLETNCWKWRVSKNDPNIVHGVHAQARLLDEVSGKVTMDKNVSDGCEYIYLDSGQICRHEPVFPLKYMALHELSKKFEERIPEFQEEIKKLIKKHAVVFHYSWLNLNRKTENGEFWDDTYHGKRQLTHNTTDDIKERIEKCEDILIKVDIEHPLKNEPTRKLL